MTFSENLWGTFPFDLLDLSLDVPLIAGQLLRISHLSEIIISMLFIMFVTRAGGAIAAYSPPLEIV